MRIISGKYRGRRLAAVKGTIRPTSDRLRGTLFNIVGDSVPGSTWLDAFAGSGAVGIEALSRGARYVVFNDTSKDAIRMIEKNLELCGVTEGHEIRQRDVFSLLRSLRPPLPDFIFFDPPYEFGRYEKLLQKTLDFGAVGPKTVIILETFKKTDVEPPPELKTLREVRSGDAKLTLFGG